MLIIGFGKLAQMIVDVHREADAFYIYNRTKSKVMEAKKQNNKIMFVQPKQFSSFHQVLLTLPPDGLKSFLKKYGHTFKKKSIFFHTATKMKKEEVEFLLPGQRIVPLKYPGHALQAIREKNGNTFAIPPGYPKEREIVEEWLGPSFSIVTGTEEEVLAANGMAVEETMKLVAQLTEQFNKQNISKPIQESVLSHIPAGVIHAHLAGEHGAFAKKVLEQWKKGADR